MRENVISKLAELRYSKESQEAKMILSDIFGEEIRSDGGKVRVEGKQIYLL